MRRLAALALVLALAACVPSPTSSTGHTTEMTPVPSQRGIWKPAPGPTWQWQLSDPPVDTSVEAEVYDIDLFDNDAAVVQALHAQGRKVICYISVG